MNQNLSSYRIFYTVANAGNISKAAKELYISQPAISKSIQKLEESVGCKLFSRSSRGVVLTEEGKLLYEHVSDAFETLTLGEEKLRRSIELGVGHLKIGVSSTLCKYLLLPYLKEFIRQNPHISISITCQSTNDTLKLLEDNKIDIGLIGKPGSLKNIHFDFLEEIEDIFVATKDYLRNLKARGVTKNQILQSSTLMLLDKNNMTRQYIDDYLQENQIQVRDSIDISNMDLLIDFARISVGVACVIKNFVKEDLESGALIEIPLGIPIHKREVGFAYKTNIHPSKSLSDFIEFYQNYNK
ncbi:MAG: LysR family transcriptional regulator [Roseburia sp.]|uniref:LysR family transcriptional regulator n=1 Tax=Roseburia sp. 831b TaxID=1261635 RepID=UPI0009519042|nr:LysR family transcriptional regulator [Roseburia sp. 831b]MCI5918682.1 LysR family transcriptional regulator [Roseburia sp.]MDY5882423.1 LysR family transcriptional regulator [Roseburia sp.]WVK74090.1 LysR family transcriptional regulator [Roseburia sp. 831b]